ncbi:MAG: carbohydrate ABC transporter permease [Chloroflexi bacterium]|nr:carbohydrate ABC transporter permease [Chloroflexota bacterium]
MITSRRITHPKVVAQRIVSRILSHATLIFAAGIIGLPFFWMISTSFKSDVEVGLFPPVWIPSALLWENYVRVWTSAPFDMFYLNSIITTLSGLVLEVIIGAMSAYAFARIEFPHRDALFLVVLATMMIPGEMALVPNYLTLRNLEWINTYQGIVIPYVSSAFGCFLLRQAFFSIPQDIFDAAKMDGAGHLRVLMSIALPMTRPVVATFALFLFIAKWNAYLWPLIVTNTWNMRTLPIGLVLVREAEGTLGWQHVMAASLLVLLPVLIVFFLAQRQIIEGIARGAVKG